MNNRYIDCVICYGETNIWKSATLSDCKHSFCCNCLKYWICIKQTCPMDRSPIKTITSYNSNKELIINKGCEAFMDYLTLKEGERIISHLSSKAFKIILISLSFRHYYQKELKADLEKIALERTLFKKTEQLCEWHQNILEVEKNMTGLVLESWRHSETLKNAMSLLLKFRQKNNINNENKHSKMVTDLILTNQCLDNLTNHLDLLSQISGNIASIIELMKTNSQSKMNLESFKIDLSVRLDGLDIRFSMMDQVMLIIKSLLLKLIELQDCDEIKEFFKARKNTCELCQAKVKRKNKIECECCRRGLCASCFNSYVFKKDNCLFNCSQDSRLVVKNDDLCSEVVCDDYGLNFVKTLERFLVEYLSCELFSINFLLDAQSENESVSIAKKTNCLTLLNFSVVYKYKCQFLVEINGFHSIYGQEIKDLETRSKELYDFFLVLSNHDSRTSGAKKICDLQNIINICDLLTLDYFQEIIVEIKGKCLKYISEFQSEDDNATPERDS